MSGNLPELSVDQAKRAIRKAFNVGSTKVNSRKLFEDTVAKVGPQKRLRRQTFDAALDEMIRIGHIAKDGRGRFKRLK